jgi:phosphatidylglycerol:prolipoprotein diacylglycerol transferase
LVFLLALGLRERELIQYPEMNPVAFSIGPLSVHWYGLMYVLGFIAGWLGLRWRAKQAGGTIQAAEVEDLVFYGALGVFVGGRIGYVLFYMIFYDLDGLLAEPLSIFYIHRGGMSFHGGLLGVLVAMWLFAKRRGYTFFAITDLIAPWIPPGLFFGRVGNFINGELWGGPTDLPWAIVYDGVARHPSQLYEALLEGVVLFAVLVWFSSRPRPRMAVSGLFLLLYGVFRIGVEFVRVPDAVDGVVQYLAGGWLTRGMLYSAPMVVAGIILLYLAYRRPRLKEAPAA